MKIIALLLSFLFTFNVMAGTVQPLEAAMDDFHYSLTVEWDQQDKAFYDKKTDAFISQMSKLIKENNVSKEQVLALAEKKMNNSKAYEALKLKLTLLQTNVSSEELAAILKESSKDFYSAGASWNGDVVSYAFIGLFVIAIGYAIWFYATHECVRKESVYGCSSYDTCVSETYDWNTGTYYCDWYREETTCGYTDVCREWQKK